MYFSYYILGPPSSPENLTYHPTYTNITEAGVMVALMWPPNNGGLSVEYTLLLTDSSHNSLTTHTTHTTNWTTSLQFNETYLVTLYASTCDHTLISDNFTTDINIQECKYYCNAMCSCVYSTRPNKLIVSQAFFFFKLMQDAAFYFV